MDMHAPGENRDARWFIQVENKEAMKDTVIHDACVASCRENVNGAELYMTIDI